MPTEITINVGAIGTILGGVLLLLAIIWPAKKLTKWLGRT